MKVVVFGGSGFLGGHVADALSDKGFEVFIYDLKKSPNLQSGQKIMVGDILNFEKVKLAVKGCDYVYNFAGVADIDEAPADPLRTIEINILGNTNVLEACRINKVKRFIFASSVYVYSNYAPFYRSSKQACELIIEDYQKSFGLDYTILRYGSIYGKRANDFNYIYRIIKQAIEEGKITRKGDGEEIRDYINVLDAARCSVDILSNEFKNQNVILAGTQSYRVKDLLRMIKEIFQGKIDIEYIPQQNKDHYDITPYTFKPQAAKKYVAGHYFDLGQGLLDVAYEVYSKSEKNGKDIACIKKLIDAESR